LSVPRALACVVIGACAALPASAGSSGAAYDWHLPRGFPVPAVPADNPMSVAKVALGRRLFFEPRLAVTGGYSCASCHDPVRAYSDGRPVAVGARGDPLARNAMALVNVAYNLSYGWSKPEVVSLEQQMLEPLLNEHPVELGMRGREQQVVAWLGREPAYRSAFDAAFPDSTPSVSFANLVKAIAAFERTLISGASPFDAYVFGGDHAALSAQAKRGMALFFSARLNCAACHSGFNFSGNWRDAQGATGPPSFASNGTTEAPLRVPTLRNIALTAPYMHDGRFATLDAVLEHYMRAGRAPDTTHGGTRDSRLRAFELTALERTQLTAFLGSLTDPGFAAAHAGARSTASR